MEKKTLKPFFRRPFPQHLHKKSEKSNKAILHKVQKTLFLDGFLPKLGRGQWIDKVSKIKKNVGDQHFGIDFGQFEGADSESECYQACNPAVFA